MPTNRPASNGPSPLVTVVLPVFNGEKVVADAIRSIQAQTFQDWELVVLDDGSTDASLEVCRACATGDSRITVVCNEANSGLGEAMSRLVTMGSGKYIAVQEQDDISVPERLELEVEVLESKPRVALVSGIGAWLDDNLQIYSQFPGILAAGRQYPESSREMVKYLYLEQCKVVNAACMFRRSVLTAGPALFDGQARMSVDWQFFLRVAHHGQVFGIHKVLVRMRRGLGHQHLSGNKGLQFAEARRCIKIVYRDYRQCAGSPIRYWLYRRAMSSQLTLEGRYYGTFKGFRRLCHALSYDPANRRAWTSMIELSMRGLRKTWKSISSPGSRCGDLELPATRSAPMRPSPPGLDAEAYRQ
ncbi:MAG: glycosyltransferase family 2 protein [Acidobacteria bacterium]|nr:glycosyltransferase family 2 protein [Acidobacteriota bacterium]